MPASRNRAAVVRPPKPPPISTTSTSSVTGVALDPLVDVGVFQVVREFVGQLDVLFVAVRAQALVALHAIALAQGVRVEVELAGGLAHGCSLFARRLLVGPVCPRGRRSAWSFRPTGASRATRTES